MTPKAIAVDALLALAVAMVAVSCAGILVMKDVFQKLHYVPPASLAAPVLVALAVTVHEGWSASTTQTWLAVAFMAATGPVLSWGAYGLPGFGRYPGPYGQIVSALSVPRVHATGVVSAVNFDFRGIDTLGEEFILFMAATGVSTVLRRLRAERERAPQDEASGRSVPSTSDTVRLVSVLLTGPLVLFGWYLTTHAQQSPAGGFQGGVLMASALMLVYLGGQYITFRRVSPSSLMESVEATGAGAFAAIGSSALVYGLPYLTDLLPLGNSAGAVNSAGTVALISFFVGMEVAAAFVLIVAEMLEQTLMVRKAS